MEKIKNTKKNILKSWGRIVAADSNYPHAFANVNDEWYDKITWCQFDQHIQIFLNFIRIL